MSLNSVHLQGNLTQDPELRYIAKGDPVCNFTVAVNRQWKDADGEKQEEVSFINCVLWGKGGEVIAEYFKQGDEILVSGRLKQETWEDKDTDKKRSAIKVIVENFFFTRGGTGDKKDKRRDDHDDDKRDKRRKIDDADVPSRSKAKGKKQDDDSDDVPF